MKTSVDAPLAKANHLAKIEPMPRPQYSSLQDWIAREAISFTVDSPVELDAAVDRMIASLGDAIELLGLGEAMHGGAESLAFRNRLFQRLVAVHGYSAIAVESSFPRGHIANEYVAGRGPASYDAVAEAGFSHGFGRMDGNRELLAWMRQYNADSAHPVKLSFYGFDGPMELRGTDSPRQLLVFALDYLASIDAAAVAQRRERIESLLGTDADWENPAAMMDASKSIGQSPAAVALRLATEDLIAEMSIRRPELIARSDAHRYGEAVHHAMVARQLLNYHAAVAGNSPTRLADLLGMRDALMADNLAYVVARERDRGKVLAFAHNSHLKRGQAHWQLGSHSITWWPAGAHLGEMLAKRYVIIGEAVGVSEGNGIASPEAGALEVHLLAAPGPARFVPTYAARGLADEMPMRSASAKNSTYFPLAPQAASDFDALLMLS